MGTYDCIGAVHSGTTINILKTKFDAWPNTNQFGTKKRISSGYLALCPRVLEQQLNYYTFTTHYSVLLILPLFLRLGQVLHLERLHFCAIFVFALATASPSEDTHGKEEACDMMSMHLFPWFLLFLSPFIMEAGDALGPC